MTPYTDIPALIEEFREPDGGQIGIDRNPGPNSTDNGMLFNATYVDMLTQEQRGREYSWAINQFKRIETSTPGLYVRYPGATDLDSHDNTIGRIYMAHLYGFSERLEEMYQVGSKRHKLVLRWCFDNEHPDNPTARSCLGRIPGLVAMLKIATNRPVGLFWSLQTAIGYLINTREDYGNTSGRCLLYLQTRMLYGKSWIMDRAIDFWRKKMKQIYPGGPKEMRGIFFRTPGHPFVIRASESWDEQ